MFRPRAQSAYRILGPPPPWRGAKQASHSAGGGKAHVNSDTRCTAFLGGFLPMRPPAHDQCIIPLEFRKISRSQTGRIARQNSSLNCTDDKIAINPTIRKHAAVTDNTNWMI